MGNQCCTSRKATGCVFTEAEVDRLNILYDELEADPNSKHGTLCLDRVFPENPDLASRVSLFMKKNSRGGQTTYESYESSLEVLIKEAAGYKLKNFQDLEKVDILALLLLDQTYMSPQKLASIPIQYDHACYYVETLLRLFQHIDGHASNIEAVAVRAVVDGVFIRGPQTQVVWWQFLEHIKKNLLCANRLLQFYFTTKFLQKPVRLRLPGLTQPSTLLSRDLLGLLYLSNMYLHPIDRMECLNSSQYSSMSFQGILQSLKTYHGPTLFLFRVSVPDPKPNSFLLGAFSLSQWKDSASNQGNNGTHLFSLAPILQVYLPTYSGAENYNFLNSSGAANVGLGFGGDGKGGFRLWIDGKDPSKSYAKAEDPTFKSGPLIPGYNGQITVDYVEVWGLGAGLSDSTFAESDSMIVRKPWITYNHAKIAELNSGSPHMAKQMADFEHRISSLHQSPYAGEESRAQGIQGSTHNYDALDRTKNFDMRHSANLSTDSPARPQEREKKSGYHRDLASIEGRSTYSTPFRTEQPLASSYTDRGRSTYTVTDGFYNPFKEQNEPILKRMSHNEIAYQQQNQQRVDVRQKW